MITTLNPAVGSRMLGGRRSVPRPDPRGLLAAMMAAAMTLSIAVVVESRLDAGGPDDVASATASQPVAAGAVPTGLTAAEWESVRRQINEARSAEGTRVGAVEASVVASDRVEARPGSVVAAAESTPAVHRAPTIAAVGTVTRFLPGSAVVASATSDASIALSTVAVGDRAVRAADALQIDDVVYYLRTPVVTEWYRETEDGLQQGFRIAEPVTDAPMTVVEVVVSAGTPVLVDPQSVRIDATAGSSFWYRELVAWDANGVVLPAHLDVVDGRITLNVETAGAAYPVTIDPTIIEDDTLFLTQDTFGDRRGQAVAVDAAAPGGPVVVVSSPGAEGPGFQAGAVFVFRRLGGSLRQEATLYAPTPGPDDFGWDVDVRGDRIVVGAPGDDTNGTDAGAVHVFERSAGSWGYAATLYSCDPVAPCGEIPTGSFGGDELGRSVAIGNDGAGDVILAGAPGASIAGVPGGAAFVYEPVGAAWQTDAARAIANANGVAGDGFGRAVDISSNGAHLVVGAPQVDVGGVTDVGAAWWFTYSGVAVDSASRLNAPGLGGASSNFGAAVAVDVHASGDIVAFAGFPIVTSEPGDGGAATQNGFSAYSVPAGTASGSPIGAFTSSTSGSGVVDAFGRSIAFDGTSMVVGSPLYDVPVSDGGWTAVYTYSSGPATLTFSGLVDVPEQAGGEWGDAVAISGDVVATAGRSMDVYRPASSGVDAGQVAIARVSSLATPAQLVSGSTRFGDDFGFAVALSGDRLAVATPGDDGAAVNGGAVYVYQRAHATSPWSLEVVLQSPSPEIGGFFGDSVDLLGDRVAIGESDRLGDQAEAGRVYVFERTSLGTWTQLGGPIVQFPGASAYDAFGASVAFVDADRLIVGAPAAGGSGRGGVFATAVSSGVWSTPVALTTGTPDPGDRVGWSVAAASGPSGQLAVAGAPGDDDAGTDAGAVYIWQDTGTGFGALTPSQKIATDTAFSSFQQVGGAVATDGFRIAAGGLGDLTAGQAHTGHVFEVVTPGSPNVWGKTWDFAGTVPVTISTPVNDYIDIFGGTVVLGRPGNGGQVGIFRDDGTTWPESPDDVFIPTGVQPGDRTGSTVSLEGSTIVVGAPGRVVDEEQGAAFGLNDLPVVHTWTGAVDANWDTPGNWDSGVVPGPADTAIVPGGGEFVNILVSAQVGVLVVGSGSTVSVRNVATLTLTGGPSGTPSVIATGGLLENQSPDTVVVNGDLTVDGTFVNLAGATLSFQGAGDQTIDGTGTLSNAGRIENLNTAGTVTVAGSLSAFTTSASATLDLADDTSFAIDLQYTEAGTIVVGPGATVSLAGDFTAASGAVVEIEIDGAAAAPASSGVLAIAGDLTEPPAPAATLRATILGGFSLVPGDAYTVVTCGNTCGTGNVIPDVGALVPTVFTDRIELAVPSGPTPIVVDTVADTIAADGSCSLREAITAANGDAPSGDCPAGSGGDVIEFAIPGGGPHTIALASALPAVTETLTIDGYSQPGASPDGAVPGLEADLRIVLDGSSAPGASGLDLSASAGSTVTGLVIANTNIGIRTGPSSTIAGNYIGTDATGSTAAPNVWAIEVAAGSDDTVIDGNLLSGNGRGISAVTGDVSGVQVLGNLIGTDASGNAALPNTGEGIYLVGGPPISGTVIGDGTVAGRNVISGNLGEGIALWQGTSGTTIRGNHIGIGVDGTTALGNALSGCGFCFGGIVIRNFTSNNVIGGELPGEGNVIAHNRRGVIAFSGTGNRIVANSIFDNVGNGLEIGASTFDVIPANDPGDFDGGANLTQNYPVTDARVEGGNLILDQSIDSDVSASAYPIQIDLYRVDSTVSGEGKTFVARTSMPAPGSESVDLGPVASLGLEVGDYIVATATDANGNTSNFSRIDGLAPGLLPNPEPDADDFFGTAIDIDGDVMVVGAYLDDTVANNAGAAYVYEKVAGSWLLKQSLVGAALASGYNFGFDVAIDDDLIVVTTATEGGAPTFVVTYRPDLGGNWVLSEELTVVGAASTYSVEIDGGRVVIGDAFGGAAFVYDDTGTSLVNQVALPDPGGTGGGFYGYEVGISGDTIVVGAPFEDTTSGVDAGAAYIWEHDGVDWTSSVAPEPPDIAANGRFGHGVAIDGGIIAVGHLGATSGVEVTGGVGVLEQVAGVWTYQQTLVGSSADDQALTGLRGSVSVLGDGIAFGVSREDTVAGADAGAAYVFYRRSGVWTQAVRIAAPDGAANEIFGVAVALGPDTVAVGAALDPFHEGAVYVFATPENPSISLSIAPSTPTAPLSVSTIALTDLPPSAFQGYGGEAADYAVSSIQTLDLRSDVVVGGEPTPVADVTLGQLGLEQTPLTAEQLDEILLAELPVAGGWAPLLEFTRFAGIPEQSLTLLDVIGVAAVRGVPIGDLGLGTTNLGNLSTYAVLMAGIPVNDLPLPLEAGQTSNLDAWCALAADVGLDCVVDFGADPTDPSANPEITLPVLSFAGVDVDGSAVLSAQVSDVDLAGSPIGDTALDELNIGVVPLSAQPLVVSPALPSYVPPSVGVPTQLDGVTLGSLGDAVPLAALRPDEVLIGGTPAAQVPLAGLELGASPSGSALFDFPWAPPSIGAATLLGDTSVPSAVAGIEVADLGLNAPILGVPLDEIILPSSGRSLASYTLAELVAETSPFGISPFGISPFGISPFGISPFGISPFGISPFGISPFGISPFGISPFGISPFGISPFGISPFGISPFGISPFGISELGDLGLNAPMPAIPLDTMLVEGRPLGDYRISELAPTNLFFDLPLQPFVVDPSGSSASPLDCSLIDCRQPNGFTIGDAVDAGALIGELTLSEVQPAMTGMYLGDLVGANSAFTQAELEAAIAAVDLTLAEAELTRPDLSLVDIPIQLLPEFETAQIGESRLFFVGYRLVDLVGLNVDFTESELEQAIADWRDVEAATGGPTTVGDLRARIETTPLADGELWVDFLNVAALADADPTLTVGDVWPTLSPLRLEYLQAASPTAPVTVDPTGSTRTIAEVQSDPGVSLEGLLWGDVLDDLTGVTVADLTGSFAGVTLGEFLRAAQPISDQKSELIDLSAIDIAAYGDGAGVTYSIDLRVDDATRPHGVRIVASLPADSRYVDLSAELSEDGVPVGGGGDFEPTRFGDTLIWTIANVEPGEVIALSFEARAPVVIGSVPVGVTAQLTDVDVFATAGTSVEFTEALEPNDTIPDADVIGPISPDEIVLSQISVAGDVDVFAVELNAGDRIGGVLWNLPADYDLAIIGPADQLISPAGGRLIDVAGDTDGGAGAAVSDAGQFAVPDGFTVIARSTNRALASEIIDPIPVQRTGRYYLVVTGYNGAQSDIAYAVQAVVTESPVTAPVCVPRQLGSPGQDGPLPASLPAGTNTLLVTNLSRMGAIHTPADAALVGAALGQFVNDLGPAGPLGALGINAAVVDVGADPSVARAMQDWDAAPCEVGLANAAVKEIVNLLDGYSSQADIEYVVMVGSDLVIPMSRLADRTLLGNEQNYAGTFAAETDTALYAALAAGTYLSDDPYVDPAPNLGSGSGIYVPIRSIGRLVESPQQIIDQLDAFAAAGGSIRTDSGSVLGYDFLLDSAFETADALSSSTSQTDVFDGPILTADLDTSLIGEGWSAEEMADQFLPDGEAPGMVSLSGHFSHQGAQSAFGSETDTADAVYTSAATSPSSTAPNAALTVFGAGLLWSVGCHSGLSASEEITANALGEDWPEVFTGQGALAYVAQTGFGYGEVDGVLLTERLMVLFAQRLDGNYTVGEALTWAKNDYFAERGVMSVYDEKSLQQAVLYGLPFGTPDVAAPPPVPPAPPTTPTTTDPVTGLQTATFSLDFEFDEVAGERGTVWEIDGTSFATHDNPLQPITTLDVTAADDDGDGTPDVRLHGSVLRSAQGTLRAGVDPVYHSPTIDLGENEPEPRPQGVIFPAAPLGSSDHLTEFGPRDSLVVIPGRFEATEADGNGVQTLFSDMVVQSYYSNSTDWTPPTVRQVRTSVTPLASAGQRSLVVSADVADASGIEAVIAVVVEDPTPGANGPGPISHWRSFDLSGPAGGATWSGATPISVCAEQVKLSVYVVDGAGNVGVMSNKAANFTSGCDAEPPVQPPELRAEPDPGTLDPGGSGWHVDSPVTIAVTSNLAPLYYEVDGGGELPVVGSSFEIDGDGVHTYVVRTLDGRVTASGVVAIDTTDPTVAIVTPTATTYVVAALPPAVFTCADPSLVSCVGTLTRVGGSPTVIESGDALPAIPGDYQLSVVATDEVENGASATVDFSVVSFPPSVVDVVGPQEPLQLGSIATIGASLEDVDGFDGETVVFDFGDSAGTTCTATLDSGGPGCSIVAPVDADTPGSVSATHVYSSPGVYEVTITVTDEFGLSTTVSYRHVVVYDPDGGFATGGGWIVPGGDSSNGDDELPGLNGVSKAHFAFVVKYKKGQQTPNGGLSFRYDAGGFRFESTELHWLVVNPSRAQFQGRGEIDGLPGLYPFKVEADDKDDQPNQVDRFTIKFWDVGADPDVDEPIYRASGDLGGGQIKVKTK